MHNVVEGVYQTNRRGTPLCPGFNTSEGCGSAVSGQWCPHGANALHLCNRCLSANHGVTGCNRTEVTAEPTALAGGKGKGRGKGKGKGKGKGGWQQRRAPY